MIATLLLALALALAACGGGSGSSSTASEAATAQRSDSAQGESSGGKGKAKAGVKAGNASATKGAGSGKGASGSGGASSAGKSGEGPGGKGASGSVPKKQHDSGGGSGQFKVKGGDNGVQEFGKEAGTAEFEAAARVLHHYLDARAERNWKAACGYLAAKLRGSSAGPEGARHGVNCQTTLRALFEGTPTATLRSEAEANVGSLRYEGGLAFLLYHAPPHATSYAITMSKEGGTWKVASSPRTLG